MKKLLTPGCGVAVVIYQMFMTFLLLLIIVKVGLTMSMAFVVAILFITQVALLLDFDRRR